MQWIVRQPLSRHSTRPCSFESSGEYKFDQIVYRDGPVKRVFIEKNERNRSRYAKGSNDYTVGNPGVLNFTTDATSNETKRKSNQDGLPMNRDPRCFLCIE